MVVKRYLEEGEKIWADQADYVVSKGRYSNLMYAGLGNAAELWSYSDLDSTGAPRRVYWDPDERKYYVEV